MFNLYEIYVRNSLTGEGGWDIGHVVALSEEDAATVPNFDCVIMKEGSYSEKFLDDLAHFPMTDAVHNMIFA